MVGLMISETAYDVALTAMVTNHRSLGHIQTSYGMVLGNVSAFDGFSAYNRLTPDLHGGMRVTIGTAT